MNSYNSDREKFESRLKKELLRKVHYYQIKKPRFVRLEQLLTENQSVHYEANNTSISNVVRAF